MEKSYSSNVCQVQLKFLKKTKKFSFSLWKFSVLVVIVILCMVFSILFTSCQSLTNDTNKTIVYQTDFGNKDGAISVMKGVAVEVDSSLHLYDLTHEIPPYSVWNASYRLKQVIDYWPENTVFVSVVDPGVGSERKSVCAKTNDNKYIITPDNGTLTHIKDKIVEVREIEKSNYRPQKSSNSYTFDGRDLYSYTAARFASGQIKFQDIGPILDSDIITLDYQKAEYKDGVLKGNIDIHDVQYGNIWTNIDDNLAEQKKLQLGVKYHVVIKQSGQVKYDSNVTYCNTFSDVSEGEDLLCYNSLECLCLAINSGSFAEKYNIEYGQDWSIEIQ